MKNPGKLISSTNPHNIEQFSAEIAGGAKKEVLTMNGERAIRRLTLEVKAKHPRKALRQTILLITFDHAAKAQVQSPIGDFFGAAPGVNPYTSLPFTVKEDGIMICRFWMPFHDAMKIVFKNRGDQKVRVTGSVYHKDYSWQAKRSMYFHAYWRVDHNLNPDFPYDLPFIAAIGKGLYVGIASYIYNPIEIPHTAGNWWGEGDEKIFCRQQFISYNVWYRVGGLL